MLLCDSITSGLPIRSLISISEELTYYKELIDISSEEEIKEIISNIEKSQKQIEDLKRIEKMLGDLKECCPNEKEMYACPIIETLINDE